MRFRLQRACSFTLIELMVVMAIVGLLAGILLAAAGGVRNQAARSQAKTEIAALETALRRFQMDNGDFPHATNANPARNNQSPNTYQAGSQTLFINLMGRDRFSDASGVKAYLDPKPTMVFTNGNPNYFLDPWGYSYGYHWSTNSSSSPFTKSAPDLWSTAGQIGTGSQTNRSKWICNWIN